MQHIEQAIAALPNLTPDQRANLRVHVAGRILGNAFWLPETPPPWIDPHDYRRIRQAAMQEAYARRVAGQMWVAGKDRAFDGSQGQTKSSTILPHKFL